MTMINIGDELYNQFHIKVKSRMGAKMHNGIKRVVNIIKNSEMPSIPNVKFKFIEGDQKN